MRDYEFIKKVDIFSAEAIAGSGSATSSVIDLNGLAAKGLGFSLQYTIAGAGSTVTFTYQLSTDGATYVTPASAADIGTSLAVGNGMLSFAPMVARFMKIIATETAGSNSVVTAFLAAQ